MRSLLLVLATSALTTTWPTLVLETAAARDDKLNNRRGNHWAWTKPGRPPIPVVKDQSWARNPIDAFILAKLESNSLAPAPEATREQLIRRASFDLLGLPPTPAEIDAYVNDRSEGAWEKVVERLLASPHYGERWGRHWLDLARFAESNGFEFDEARPDAWRYRDYVIQSLNEDKPFDRFALEQLAGDELFPNDAAALVATGFNLLGADMTDSSDQAQRRQNTLTDMTDTAGLVFLGLTVGCARCHDHKFEPIPQADYYRLQAFFTPTSFRRDLPIATHEQQMAFHAALKEYLAITNPTRAALAKLETPYRQRLHEARLARLGEEARSAHQTSPAQRTAVQKDLVVKTARLLGVSPGQVLAAMSEADRSRHKALTGRLKQLDVRKPAPLPVALGLQDPGGIPPKTFVLERGERANPAAEVRPGFPIVLMPDHRGVPASIEPPHASTTGRRSALARWIASPDNPLTARVIVNRLWQHHFGRGIVRTANDFGLRGDPPTHRELLDWLALELASGGREPTGPRAPLTGWTLKRMHRLMLLSATYRQASHPSRDALKLDPDNTLFSRMNRARLEGEAVRDSLLVLSGRLNHRRGGPGVFPPIPAEALRGVTGWTTSPDPHDHVRRSIYIFARRNLRFPFLEAFDLPDSNLSCPKRERSTTAPQALALLNAGDVLAAANALAASLGREGKSDEERIARAFRLTLGRPPTEKEKKLARRFLAHTPLSGLCRALFNVNEFIYID
jgi:hypothetical protein